MDVNKLWQGAKQVLAVILGGVIVLFAFVNLAAVQVNLLFTQVELSLSLLILISAVAGMSLGWMGGALRGRRKRKAIEAGYRDELPVSTEDEAWLAEGTEEEVAVPREQTGLTSPVREGQQHTTPPQSPFP